MPVGTLARGLRPRRESSSGRPPAANDIEAQTPRPSPQSQSFSQAPQRQTAEITAIQTLHRTIQSVGATGGVYKGQGRNQRELMTRAY
ncbi:hypothetical protein CBR_g48878 [Chara braunii]|uniref:Uncharacterized protein n=2 Tax=Chara braunii TaxID=69332 RepID=A0A388M3K8_CHABU|nr:hypothetical protein CBR_g48878 [Chara braunii]|eukprot:GBG89170.1 hypothetical protein CBR_g48878 [Chara braunii]